MKTTRQTNQGFTLIELLVVSAVLMMLALIALPAAGMDDHRKLDVVQLGVQDALDYAQRESYKSGVPYGVRFGTNAGGWFAVVNAAGIPVEDPLSHGDYVVRFTDPGYPTGVTVDYATFGVRPVAAYDEKGVLVFGGQIHLRAGDQVRWLQLTTASPELEVVPVTP